MIKLISILSLSFLIVGCNSIGVTSNNANIHFNQYGINANIYTNIEI